MIPVCVRRSHSVGGVQHPAAAAPSQRGLRVDRLLWRQHQHWHQDHQSTWGEAAAGGCHQDHRWVCGWCVCVCVCERVCVGGFARQAPGLSLVLMFISHVFVFIPVCVHVLLLYRLVLMSFFSPSTLVSLFFILLQTLLLSIWCSPVCHLSFRLFPFQVRLPTLYQHTRGQRSCSSSWARSLYLGFTPLCPPQALGQLLTNPTNTCQTHVLFVQHVSKTHMHTKLNAVCSSLSYLFHSSINSTL